ncbi:hypothetical protein V8F33_006551 [Rhypophila sp. PSN 637]
MAPGKRPTTPPEATLRGSGSSGLGHVRFRSGLLSLLAVPGLDLLQLTSGTTTTTKSSTASTTIGTAIASTSTVPLATASNDDCQVTFLYPAGDSLEFYHLDTLNVTYQSSFARPTLHCWCSEPDSKQVVEHLRVDNASPLHGSVLVPLNFTSAGVCWFDLRSDDSRDCRHRSQPFALSSKQRHIGRRALPTFGLDLPAPILAPRATGVVSLSTSSLAAAQTTPAGAVTSQASRGGGDSLGPGARVGLAIGLTFAVIIVGAMAAFLIFKRRKRHQDATLAGAIFDHDRRHGRKGPEKNSRNVAPSVQSGNSDEPLYPVQPVLDGYPGSTGYDDVRSIESSTQGHSPTMPHSPTFSQNTHNGHWGGQEHRYTGRDELHPEHRYSGRDELHAARMNSSVAVVTSYGPNPVTPTLTPRPSSRVDLNVRAGNVSIDSREDIPPMPGVSIMPEYITFGAFPTPIPRIETTQIPTPPRKAAPPIVVSYGPNRVTPTPAVTTPTVPLDDAIVKRRIQNNNHNNNQAAIRNIPPPLENHDSWGSEEDEPMMAASTMGPLPPYATSEEFDAMEKGAVRKLPEPEAYELPPTKDGFYSNGNDIVEYELPGSAPQSEPQLPYDPYRQRLADSDAGPSNGRSGGWRDIDEQKFLLSDADMAKLREEKVRQRAARLAAEQEQQRKQELEEQRLQQGQGESYRMEEVYSGSMARR